MTPPATSAEPLVSVVLLAYNQARTIGRALDSILAQQRNFPLEIVVGEDCSQDNTRAIIQQYAQRHPGIIRQVTSGANIGARRNYHRTVQAATAKYLAFCDGDDYWHRPDKLQLQIAFLESHPDCGLVYSDYDVDDVASCRRSPQYYQACRRAIPENPTITDIVGGRAGILTCTVVARRDLVHRAQHADPYLHLTGPFLMSDTQLWAEVATQASVRYFRDSLATYTRAPESLSHSQNPARSTSYELSNTEMLLYLCEKHALPTALRHHHENRRASLQMQLAFWQSDVTLGREARRNLSRVGLRDLAFYLGSQHPQLNRLLRRGAQLLRRSALTIGTAYVHVEQTGATI